VVCEQQARAPTAKTLISVRKVPRLDSGPPSSNTGGIFGGGWPRSHLHEAQAVQKDAWC
jgi:hypothetical protein